MYVYILYGLLSTSTSCHPLLAYLSLVLFLFIPSVDDLYQVLLSQWWFLLHQQCSPCRWDCLWQQEGQPFKVFTVCLSIYLSVYLYVCLSICLSVRLSVCQSVSVCLSVYPSVCLSVCLLYTYVCTNIHMCM